MRVEGTVLHRTPANSQAPVILGKKRAALVGGGRFQRVHSCAPVCAYVLDNFINSGYTGNRKGAAGRRLAPYIAIEVTAKAGELGGYFFLFCT